ncbi:MAG TPA: DUF6152 family protein [Steroidobacteraceae bacterium]|jgi:hypothetical protein
MRRFPTAVVSVAVMIGLMATFSPVFAHHSGAMFDISKKVDISGTIVDFNWSNPHANFKVNVAQPGGGSEVWAVEMNSPNNLVRDGWKRTTLKPGDKVTVTVRPLRDGTPGGQYVSIVLADGKVLGGEQQR